MDVLETLVHLLYEYNFNNLNIFDFIAVNMKLYSDIRFCSCQCYMLFVLNSQSGNAIGIIN